jgi:hypothetical protein
MPLGDGATRDRRLVRATPMGMGVVRRRRCIIFKTFHAISPERRHLMTALAKIRRSPVDLLGGGPVEEAG